MFVIYAGYILLSVCNSTIRMKIQKVGALQLIWVLNSN